jgi:hypothetical protein
MNSSNFSSLEPLEQRIAPAGLVTATFANGVLTLSGGDGQDHDVDVLKTGKTKFSVTGAGTSINELGNTSENFKGKLKEVRIEGGAGADSFSLTKLKPLKAVNFEGGMGVDSLTTTNLKVAKAGKVEIALGSESGTVDFGGDRTLIGGILSVDLGGGGAMSLLSAETLIRGNVAVVGGSQSDSISIGGASTVMKGELSFSGGGGDDTFNATGNSLAGEARGDNGWAGWDESLHVRREEEHLRHRSRPCCSRLEDRRRARQRGLLWGLHLSLRRSEDRPWQRRRSLSAKFGRNHVRNSVEVTGGAGNDVVELAGGRASAKA